MTISEKILAMYMPMAVLKFTGKPRAAYEAGFEDAKQQAAALSRVVLADLPNEPATVERLQKALKSLIDLNNDHSPFGGEMYQDRIERAWYAAREALKVRV